MLDMGKQTSQFFTSYTDEYGRKKYRLKTIEQFSREHGTQEQPGKKYFAANALPDIVRTAPQPKSATKPADLEKGLSAHGICVPEMY
jgi:dual specificity protein kinase YAK1